MGVTGRWQVGHAQSRSHVLSPISGARGAVDSVALRALMDLSTCWSERAVYAGERAVGGEEHLRTHKRYNMQ